MVNAREQKYIMAGAVVFPQRWCSIRCSVERILACLFCSVFFYIICSHPNMIFQPTL